MRILTVSSCPLDPLLGSGKTRLRWSQGLRALGHDVDVLEPEDFEWLHGRKRAVRFRQALGAVGTVQARLREHAYDLVEFFGGEFGIVTKRLSRETVRPFMVAHTDGFELLASERQDEYDRAATPLARLRKWYRRQTHDRLSFAAFAYADAFVTGCQLDLKRFHELDFLSSDRAAVVSPGLDDEYLLIPVDAPKEQRVVFTGSWIARKGVRNAVAVMNEVMHARPDVRLDLYGTACPPDMVRNQFAAAVRDRIAVHGPLSNQAVAQGLSKAKVFFFPTQYEGFGMALAEAMACGCAAVTTRTGFGAELRDGAEALLCAFDDREAMRKAVIALLDDDKLRSSIAGSAWRRVRSLGWGNQVRRLEATYLSWLAAAKC